MIARLAVPVLMAWTGWAFLTPIPSALLLSQLPLVVIVAGWLLERPPAAARSARPAAPRLVYRRPPVVVVVRPAELSTIAAWRAREAGRRRVA